MLLSVNINFGLIFYLKGISCPHRDANPQLTSMKIDSNSVDSALDFDTSNQSKLNFLRRDLNTSLMTKIQVFSC